MRCGSFICDGLCYAEDVLPNPVQRQQLVNSPRELCWREAGRQVSLQAFDLQSDVRSHQSVGDNIHRQYLNHHSPSLSVVGNRSCRRLHMNLKTLDIPSLLLSNHDQLGRVPWTFREESSWEIRWLPLIPNHPLLSAPPPCSAVRSSSSQV